MTPDAWVERSRPVIRHDVERVVIDGESVVWDPVRDRVHHVDRVGTLLWELLNGGASIGDLADDVAAVFGVDPTTAVHDILRLIQQLDDAALLA